jgi:N-acetyl sugar amidotransferase
MNLFRCRRCLYTNTKPDIWFDDAGVCSACLAFDKRKTINWAQRQEDFLSLVRANPGSTHDVIVACSGGKDSTWQVVKCLELGLRPLAITATTDHLSNFGRRNLDNISNLCDHIEVTPHKPTRRKISKFALQEIGDISWCEHQLIWSVPARESVARNIPIVLYGEAQNNEYGAGRKGTEDTSQLDKDWVDEYGGLLSLRLSDMTDILGIEARHLELYRYPSEAEKIKALFMGAFFPWDGLRNAEIAEAHGFSRTPFEVEGSFGNFENIDNAQTGAHDLIRFYKFGYGRAVDIISSYIRRGRLTRDEGVKLALEREGVFPETYLGVPLDAVLDNIGCGRSEFNEICNRFKNEERIAWALNPASYQCFYGQTTDASRGEDLAKTAA